MDQKHGKGKSSINGTIYEGEYNCGKRDGFGKLIALSGNIYEGQFKNDRKNGIGKLTYCKITSDDEPPRILEGIWEKDKFMSSDRPSTSASVTVLNTNLDEHK